RPVGFKAPRDRRSRVSDMIETTEFHIFTVIPGLSRDLPFFSAVRKEGEPRFKSRVTIGLAPLHAALPARSEHVDVVLADVMFGESLRAEIDDVERLARLDVVDATVDLH